MQKAGHYGWMATALGIKSGEGDVHTGVFNWKATALTDPNRSASLRISVADLGNVDFGSPVQVLDLQSAEPLFTGFITEAALDDQTWALKLRTPSLEISEQRSDGLIIGPGVPVAEQIRSLLSVAGVPDDRMSIHGLSLPLPNPFEVVAPIEYLRNEVPIPIGDVTFVSELTGSMAVDDLHATGNDGLDNAPLLDRYRVAESWAHVIVQSSSLDEAEALGLDHIDTALGQLMLVSRFSYSVDPTGIPRPFVRKESILGKVARRPIVHVRALRTPHRWLRGLDTKIESSAIDAQLLGLLSHVPTPSDPKLRYALRTLRRVLSTKDPYDRISAIWQTVELYVSSNGRQRPPKLFTSDVLRSAFRRATGGLTGEQTARLNEIKQMANEPPLLVRFEHSIAGDSVPYETFELDALKRTRKLRNDLEHGKVLSAIQAADIQMSVSLLIRVLVFALAQDGNRVG